MPVHKAVGARVLGSAQMSGFQTISSSFVAQGRAQPGAALASLPVPAPQVFLQISVTISAGAEGPREGAGRVQPRSYSIFLVLAALWAVAGQLQAG